MIILLKITNSELNLTEYQLLTNVNIYTQPRFDVKVTQALEYHILDRIYFSKTDFICCILILMAAPLTFK